MPDYPLTQGEKDILKVTKSLIDETETIPHLSQKKGLLDEDVSESEELLASLGRQSELKDLQKSQEELHNERQHRVHPAVELESFESLLEKANERYPQEITFTDILTKEEIAENRHRIAELGREFDTIHHLDKVDVLIPVVAGILSGVLDCVLGGLTPGGSPHPLNRFVQDLFNKALPPERIKEFEERAKVPFDALNYNNRGNLEVDKLVHGLDPLFHHGVSLAHDPSPIGLIAGIFDILNRSVTTIDRDGVFLIQKVEGFSGKPETKPFHALTTVLLHWISDVNGSSAAKNGGTGLPVPFMALFNKLQFGQIGDNKTIADMVQSMYYEGYDFRHFCAMSLPVMLNEVVVRIAYFAKRLHEGHSFQEALPVGLNPEKKPKLRTMLFLAHSASTAINLGRVVVTKNPMDINYPQWMAFFRYSLSQLKWALTDKPELRGRFITAATDKEWDELFTDIDSLWDEYAGTVLSPEE